MAEKDKTIDDGGFAFPLPVVQHKGKAYVSDPGLTQRKLFSAIAMQGILANPVLAGETESLVADKAVKQAEALIERLKS